MTEKTVLSLGHLVTLTLLRLFFPSVGIYRMLFLFHHCPNYAGGCRT